jgi:hypothetical protein
LYGLGDRGLVAHLDAQVVQRLDVVHRLLRRLEGLDHALEQLHLGDDRLGQLLVVPEALGPHLLFQFLAPGDLAGEVKESRGCCASAPRARRSSVTGSREA